MKFFNVAAKASVLVLTLITVERQVWANLCDPKKIESRHWDEARALKTETFSASDYAGDESYNATIIGCNRDRDGNRKAIEDKVQSNTRFADNLAPRLIKGHIQYYGFAAIKYAYQLERKNGTWIVTVPVEFHFPNLHSKKIDIPMSLATDIGIDAHACANTYQDRHGNIESGYVDTGNSKRIDNACRVGRDDIVSGQKITTHLMKFWKNELQSFWSHTGFQVVIKVVDLNEVPADLLSKYKKRDTIWPIRMNLNPESRATYRAVFGKPHPLYSGLTEKIFNHEFGHELGLDDEYPENDNHPSWRDCVGMGGTTYIMCNSFTSTLSDAKGVYDWIITRRYMVGDKLENLE